VKTTALAAVAALVAVARMASAQTGGSPEPAGDETVRAAVAEARSLLATMQNSARIARRALEQARARRDPDELRCADEALSRADVALRRGREDAALLAAQLATHDVHSASATLRRVRQAWTASHDAAASASWCSARKEWGGMADQTIVNVYTSQ